MTRALDVDDLDQAVGLDEEAVGGDVDQHVAEPRLAGGPERRRGPAGLADQEGQRLVAFQRAAWPSGSSGSTPVQGSGLRTSRLNSGSDGK